MQEESKVNVAQSCPTLCDPMDRSLPGSFSRGSSQPRDRTQVSHVVGRRFTVCATREFSIPGLGRSPGENNGYPLQYFCLENSKDRGAQRATVHQVARSQIRSSNYHSHTHIHTSSMLANFFSLWIHQFLFQPAECQSFYASHSICILFVMLCLILLIQCVSSQFSSWY